MSALDSQNENLQAHLCFGTTTAVEAPFPAPVVLRELRCHVQRSNPVAVAATLAGIYFVTLEEDIGGAAGEALDLDANVGTPAAAGGLINVIKIAPFVWKIELFTITLGAYALDDLVSNAPATVNLTFRRVNPS